MQANYDVFMSGLLPKWNKLFFGKSCTVYVHSMYCFYAVAEEKYTAKKNLVDPTGYVPDRDDQMDEMYRIIRNVIKTEMETGANTTTNDDN